MQGSPYVEQIEKYASSLKQLSHTFLELEAHKEEFSGADIDGMFDRVKERVCKKCEKNAWCWGENFVHTYQMGYDVLSAVDHYGNELNVETKRKLMQRCEKAPRFLREMLEGFRAISDGRVRCINLLNLFKNSGAVKNYMLRALYRHDTPADAQMKAVLLKSGLPRELTELLMGGEGT